MANRKYENYSEPELLALRRDLEESRAQLEEDRDSYTSKFPGSDWVWTSEDYLSYSEKIGNHDNQLIEIDNELDIRRKERAAR